MFNQAQEDTPYHFSHDSAAPHKENFLRGWGLHKVYSQLISHWFLLLYKEIFQEDTWPHFI